MSGHTGLHNHYTSHSWITGSKTTSQAIPESWITGPPNHFPNHSWSIPESMDPPTTTQAIPESLDPPTTSQAIPESYYVLQFVSIVFEVGFSKMIILLHVFFFCIFFCISLQYLLFQTMYNVCFFSFRIFWYIGPVFFFIGLIVFVIAYASLCKGIDSDPDYWWHTAHTDRRGPHTVLHINLQPATDCIQSKWRRKKSSMEVGMRSLGRAGSLPENWFICLTEVIFPGYQCHFRYKGIVCLTFKR